MIKQISIFLVLFNLSLFSEIESDKFIRLNVDLNGAIKNKNETIIYGTNGCLITSTDNCNTFEQHSIGDSINILKIVNINNEIRGIAINNNLPILYDFKIDLKMNSIKINKIDFKFSTLGKIFFFNNKFYIGSISRIISYDILTFEIQSVYSDISKPYLHLDEFQMDDSLIYISTTEKSLIKYNYLEKYKSEISLAQFDINYINITLFKDNIYFLYYNKLIKFSSDLKNWDSISLLDSSCNLYSSKYLYIYNINTTNKYFNIISKDGLSFTNIPMYNLDFNNYLKRTSINQVIEIDSNYNLAVGLNKTIIKLNTNSQKTELKSFLITTSKTYHYTFYNKEFGFVSNDSCNFYNTKNGGVTWLPTLKGTTISNKSIYTGYNYISNASNYTFFNNGNKSNQLIYSFDSCQTFTVKNMDSNNYHSHSNLLKINDLYYYAISGYNYDNIFSNLYVLNEKYDIINQVHFDSLKINYISKNNKNELILVANEFRHHKPKIIGTDESLYDSAKIILMFSKDSCKYWNNRIILNNSNNQNIFSFLLLDNKSYFLSIKYELDPIIIDTLIYLYELSNNDYNVIDTFNNYKYSQINYLNIFNSELYCFSYLNYYYVKTSNNVWIKYNLK
ncbi:MAG: hypothetical protein NTW25_01770 [Candidatus Kapabacteria bacterium]|nr:hypothetical protein [Candidatus Kapabacteria bacterium]